MYTQKNNMTQNKNAAAVITCDASVGVCQPLLMI